MSLTLVVLAAVAGAALLVKLAGLRIDPEYQRAVVFRFGRLSHMKAPGLRLALPIVDRLVRVDLRAVHFEIPAQEVITEDNVMVAVRAVVYIQVVNPPLAVTKVVDYAAAASHLVQSSLRSTLGQVTLGDLLTGRDKVNSLLAGVINQELERWGIQVTAIEIKDVLLPDAILRALGREAEAERETKAKLITAEGELATVRALSNAAGAMAGSATILQLRYLQTLSEIGNDRSTVVVFPLPIDLVQPILDMQAGMRKGAAVNGEPKPAEPHPDPRPGPVELERPEHVELEARPRPVDRDLWRRGELEGRRSSADLGVEYREPPRADAPPPPPPPPA